MTQYADQTFGQLLQQARLEKKHLSPRDLARSANVSEAVYKGWEVGQGRPNRLQLAKMFGSNHRLHLHLPKKTAAIEAATPLAELEPRSIDNVVAKTFGDALCAEREREGLSQDDLGALLSPPVTNQAVSAWEMNISAPVRDNLEQLYELLPNLALAPKPHSQDIPVPNGGKGVPRTSAPPSPPIWIQPTLSEAAPLRPEPPEGAPPIYTFSHTFSPSTEPMPTTPAAPATSTPIAQMPLQDSQLIEQIYTLCTKLHGGEWRVCFFKKDGVWRASAEADKGVLEYRGETDASGKPHDALIALLRDARNEVDRRRRELDELERELPKEVF